VSEPPSVTLAVPSACQAPRFNDDRDEGKFTSGPTEKEDLDQVIVGNCFAPVEQNIARVASLLMGVPDRVPGHTIDCACASASQAIISGANAIALGQADIVLAGGVESMSNAPYIMETARWGQRLRHAQLIDLFWKGMQEYPVGGGMGIAAERLAENIISPVKNRMRWL